MLAFLIILYVLFAGILEARIEPATTKNELIGAFIIGWVLVPIRIVERFIK